LPQDQIAYVAFDLQKTIWGQDSLYHQARWNRGVSLDMQSVSEYLSERQVSRINPYQIVEEQTDPAEFMARQEEVIQVLGLDRLLSRDINQISNGERRKVLLARALLRNPRLLILDNPFTGLDVAFRAKLKQMISSLMKDEMRVILVMNDRDEIPPGITHVLLMDDRGVVAQGPGEMILKRSPAQGGVELEGPAITMLPSTEDQETDHQVLVDMEHVSVSYAGVPILNDINWTVRKGEKWALLGPNGAGKTTLLSLILGDNPHAYAHEITLFGIRRGSGESIWDIKRNIGWVAPELHLYYPKNVTCYDVVCSGFFSFVGRHRRCSPQQRETARGWLQRLGFLQHADMAFGRISEGEQRMILIARALVKDPGLLVLDEPCQGLDAGNRDRVLRMVEAIGSDLDTTIIYVTHHRDALPKVITHVLRLDEGRVVSRQKVGEHRHSESLDPIGRAGAPNSDLTVSN
jgi:molybdate transport system ATP-binding protein